MNTTTYTHPEFLTQPFEIAPEIKTQVTAEFLNNSRTLQAHLLVGQGVPKYTELLAKSRAAGTLAVHVTAKMINDSRYLTALSETPCEGTTCHLGCKVPQATKIAQEIGSDVDAPKAVQSLKKIRKASQAAQLAATLILAIDADADPEIIEKLSENGALDFIKSL